MHFKEDFHSVLRTSSAHNKGGPPGRGPLCEKVLRKAIPWQPPGE